MTINDLEFTKKEYGKFSDLTTEEQNNLLFKLRNFKQHWLDLDGKSKEAFMDEIFRRLMESYDEIRDLTAIFFRNKQLEK